MHNMEELSLSIRPVLHTYGVVFSNENTILLVSLVQTDVKKIANESMTDILCDQIST